MGREELLVQAAEPSKSVPVTQVVGFALVALAGVAIVVSSVLVPWIRSERSAVEASASAAFDEHGVADYTGWDLAERCGQWNGATKCSIGVVEGRRSVATGPVTAGLGVLLLVLGIIGVVASYARRRTLVALAALGACFAAGAAVAFVMMFSFESTGLDLRVGVWVFVAAAVVALVASLIASAASRHAGPPRGAFRVFAVIALLVLGWIGGILVWTA